jgi:D-glycero-D-manno-heptose 1,7-bisphosphate phosphatase
MNKALFLDRDGVLNKKARAHEYITSSADFIWNNSAQELIKFAKDLGYIVCVITNQQGVGKWLYSLQDVSDIHNGIQSDLQKIDAKIDGFYVCPHLASASCDCRKPEPGLLLQAIHDYDIDITHSFFIGDSKTDIEAWERARIPTFKIGSDMLDKDFDRIMELLNGNI